jgi:hypothetical protein
MGSHIIFYLMLSTDVLHISMHAKVYVELIDVG